MGLIKWLANIPLTALRKSFPVGPIPMMWAVVNSVAGNGKYNPETDYREGLVRILVSLNPIMVDGTGFVWLLQGKNIQPRKEEI